MIYESNLQHFVISKRYDNKAQCKCPAHNDKQASLTITKGNKCTLFYCHAGCSVEEILAAVGLEKKDTFYDKEEYTTNWKNYVESRERKKIEAIYNYVSCNGTYTFTKIRLEGKKLLYGILENERFTYGLPRNTPRKSLKAIYGNVKAINKAINENKPIFIVEGEKDVDTMAKQGYTAFTYGGVNDWQSDFAEIVKGANVIILADNDNAGIKVANTIKNDIKAVTNSAKVVIPMPDTPKADITDYFEAGHTKDEFEQMINTVTENRKAEEKPRSLVELLEQMQVASKYETNDKGFGYLFADVFKGKHRYNSDRKEFMYYDGKRWIDDAEAMRAKNSAKELSDALLVYAVKGTLEKDKSEYLKQVTSLVNIRNRHNMLQDSKDVYYFQNSDLDKDDYILNVSNGTIDLSDIEPKFTEHKADMLLSKICNANYDENATCETWIKFLDDVMQGDKDKIRYLQKIAGLSLTGNTEQETMFILYGSTTRNGKSTFCETLMYLLGDYALTMQPQSLAVKQNLDSRQASGDIARLDGCRLCNASEPPKRMLFDTALLKSLLGRDSITARHLHQREFTFIPKFKMLMNTNYLPTITDDTVFSSGRINVISFDRHFEPHEQDKTLKQKLRSKKELSGILNWCIEGLRLYRLEGLIPPLTVQMATDTYRTDSDKIGNFLNECMTKCDRNSKAKDVYDIYAEWCNENGFGCENKGNFFAELKSKNIFASSGTVDGKTFKNIVKGYVIAENEFQKTTDENCLPFN